MGDSSARLGRLLEERVRRLRERRGAGRRLLVAEEDLIRWKQSWRTPYYRITGGGSENCYPPRWIVQR